MSALPFTHLTTVRGARRSLRAAVGVALAVAATGVTAKPVDAQKWELYPPGFTNWPSELASRAPALADAIERELGERPYGIEFFERDKLIIVIRNPGFWRDDMVSKALPRNFESPVRKAGQHIAEYVWSTFARDAGINLVNVTFVRLRREQTALLFSHEVATQYVGYSVSRQQFEIGHAELGLIGIVDQSQNNDGTPPSSPKTDSGGAKLDEAARHEGFVRGPLRLAPRGLALVDSLARVFERPRELEFTGKDTIEVTFWSPAFWLNDMQSKAFPRASLPLVAKAAEQVGRLIWRIYGRDAGIDVIRVTFVRMRRVNTSPSTREVPVQQLTAVLTRKQLETGPRQSISLTMTQR